MSRLARSGVLATCLVLFGSSVAHASWNEATIYDGGTGTRETSSLALSPGGKPYAAYVGRGDDLFWARLTAEGWRSKQVAGQGTFIDCYDSANAGVGPSAAFKPDGTPQIASVCVAGPGGAKVSYAVKKDGAWRTKVVGFGPGGEPCSTSATDIDLINHPKGRPAIVITNQCTKEVTGFFLRKGKWVTQVLLEGDAGSFRYPTLALAVDPLSGHLILAGIGDRYGRGGLSVFAFSWSGRQVGSPKFFALPRPEVPYGEPVIGFLPDGTGYLAFQAGSPPGTPVADAYSYLGLVKRTGGVWGTRTVIDRRGPITGAEPSLSLAGGMLHVAYQDVTNGDLRYATSADGMTWRRTTITGPNDTGAFPSLVVSDTGKATIAHFDRTDTALLSARGR